MEGGLRRFLQVASSKREASGLDPEAVHFLAVAVPLLFDNLQPVARAVGGGTLSYAPPASVPVMVAFVAAQTVLLGGVEEIGWRGYLQPRLQERLSVVTAGLCVGIIWWAWHLPLFFGHDQFALEFGFLAGYTLTILGASVVYGAFVNATDGRVLPLMLLHGTSNLGAVLAGADGTFDGTGLISIVVGAGLWWAVVAVLLGRFGRRMVPTPLSRPIP